MAKDKDKTTKKNKEKNRWGIAKTAGSKDESLPDDNDRSVNFAAEPVDRPSMGDKASRPVLSTAGLSKASILKANNIMQSAGTSRLNRILDQPTEYRIGYVPDLDNDLEREPEHNARYKPRTKENKKMDKVNDPMNEAEVAAFVGKVVVPELKVDPRSIGGQADKLKKVMVQETLVSMRCKEFTLSGTDLNPVSQSAFEYPDQYAKHKRSLGFAGGPKARNKIKYVLLVRSTNRPLSSKAPEGNGKTNGRSAPNLNESNDEEGNDDDDDDYDKMYRPEDGEGEDVDIEGDKTSEKKDPEGEISSFPVFVCMTINPDGTSPDVRKLVELDQLTTVQNVTTGGATVVQLVFQDGDTVKLDFAVDDAQESTASMRKEKFIWSLLQIHAMLCTSVVERNSLGTRNATPGSSPKERLLQPLNVRNLDRAELQYVATVNGFLRDSPTLLALLDRQRDMGPGHGDDVEDEKKEEMDGIAYDMMMGNFSTRVAIYNSAEERADAEEVLNCFEVLTDEEDALAADTLRLKLEARMQDLEAETCRRLIAWEDEKHYSLMGHDFDTADRDSEDALSLAGLFKTLDSLDKELDEMEGWLHDRASVIKPLTDDCRDIEEENRQLEQQWKSYELLGDELKRVLTGVGIEKSHEKVLTNPAGALVYDGNGNIDVIASDQGVDLIHIAGKALKQAMENAKKAGCVHLRAVNERVEDLTVMSNSFCQALAMIIVTVMEQIKAEVMVASDNGKVSKSDTHAMIAKKIRDVSSQKWLSLRL
jgi:hypothetical protein